MCRAEYKTIIKKNGGLRAYFSAVFKICHRLQKMENIFAKLPNLPQGAARQIKSGNPLHFSKRMVYYIFVS